MLSAHCYRSLFALAVAASLLSCGNSSTPLDAETRDRIDSLANAQISDIQVKHDSLCKNAQQTQLPRLVDSIKQIRLQEIEEQLKTVPK